MGDLTKTNPQLTPVESLRAAILIEEALKQLSFVGKLSKEQRANKDSKFAAYRGDEIIRIIDEQQELQQQYAAAAFLLIISTQKTILSIYTSAAAPQPILLLVLLLFLLLLSPAWTPAPPMGLWRPLSSSVFLSRDANKAPS